MFLYVPASGTNCLKYFNMPLHGRGHDEWGREGKRIFGHYKEVILFNVRTKLSRRCRRSCDIFIITDLRGNGYRWSVARSILCVFVCVVFEGAVGVVVEGNIWACLPQTRLEGTILHSSEGRRASPALANALLPLTFLESSTMIVRLT